MLHFRSFSQKKIKRKKRIVHAAVGMRVHKKSYTARFGRKTKRPRIGCQTAGVRSGYVLRHNLRGRFCPPFMPKRFVLALSSASEEAQEGEEDIDKIEIEFERTDDRRFFERIRSVRIFGRL